jgi:hypothetical protein
MASKHPYKQNQLSGGTKLIRVIFAVTMLLAMALLYDKIFEVGYFDFIQL